MADIANIRRRRLERLANNSAPVAARPEGKTKTATEDVPSTLRESGGMTEESKDSTVPSEFECILCLRCVSLRHSCGTERGRARVVHSKGLPFCYIHYMDFFFGLMRLSSINYLLLAGQI